MGDKPHSFEACLGCLAEIDALKAHRTQLEAALYRLEHPEVDPTKEARRRAFAQAAEVVKHLSHEDGLGMGSQRIESAILKLGEG